MIIYAAIARASDAAVLADCSDPQLKGNAALVTSLLFCHLRDHPEYLQEGEHQTMVQRNDGQGTDADFFSTFVDNMCMVMGEDMVEEHYFHLSYKQNVMYCCIGDDADLRDQKVNFAYLDRLFEEFTQLYNPKKIQHAQAYGMEKNFRPRMRSAMHHYNVNHDTISREAKVQELLTQVQDMKAVMGRNINLMLEHGENIESMMTRTEELEQEAQVFYKKSRLIKQKQKKKYYKQYVVYAGIIGGIVMFLVFLILVKMCGIDFSYCRNPDYRGNGGD